MANPLRVLIVEDNEDDALLLVNALKDGGYQPAFERVDTSEGLKTALLRNEWDCVLSDYSMPQFNGLAALRALKEHGLDIPFILVSGTVGEDVAVAAMKAGAHDYIMKDKLMRLVPALERELADAEVRRKERQATAALKESKGRFFSAFEYSAIGMALVAPDGRWIRVNHALCAILGYSDEELLKTTFQDITHPDDLETDLVYVRQMLAGKIRTCQMEKRYFHKQGQIVWVLLSVSLVRDNAGQPQYFISQIQDITDRKRAEEALRASQEVIVGILDAMPIRVFWKDINLVYLGCNAAFAADAGFVHPKEIIGKDDYELGWRDQAERYKKDDRLVIESGSPRLLIEEPQTTPQGATITLLTSKIPLRDSTGAVRGILGTYMDITERKRAEEHLREREEQFRLIAENVADMIAVVDLDGRRIYNSPSYESILGNPELLRGTDGFQEIHPDDVAKVKKVFQETVKTGVGQKMEYRLLGKDGSERTIDSKGGVIRDRDGKIFRVVVVSRDVTEEKRLAAQFMRAQRMESIGTLAGGIAHDLNNVLAPIMMAIHILRIKTSDPQTQRILDTMDSSAKRGSDIVKQVLAFGRGVTGDRLLVQLKHIVTEVVKIAGQTFPKSIEIRTDMPRDLWTVSADPTQMHQVLLNMLVNARDAMPKGGILTISVENIQLDETYSRMHVDAKPGAYVSIAITDTGTGIPSDIREKIFEPFFTTKEIGMGTGLGLSTTLAIVKSHGGFINLDSETGKGTTFRIYIPATETPSAEAPPSKQAALPMGHGELILVIDDEASIREITKETLQAHGYTAITAGDGAEGVTLFAENKENIKVVITDMMMPVMDGSVAILVLQKIKPDVKIIAASGLTSRGQTTTPPDPNVQAFLTKPYSAETLLNALAEVLQ